MELRYLKFIRNKYIGNEAFEVSVNRKEKLFIEDILEAIINKIFDDIIKCYKSDLSDTVVIKFLTNHSDDIKTLNTIKNLSYCITNSERCDAALKNHWINAIKIIKEFELKLHEFGKFKKILEEVKITTPKELEYINVLLEQYPKEPTDDISKLNRLAINNKNMIINFMNNPTLITVPRQIIDSIKSLNINIYCNDAGEIKLLKYAKTNCKLLITIDILKLLSKYLTPAYSAFLYSAFFSANERFVSNYAFYYINTYVYEQKTNTLKQNQYHKWGAMIESIYNGAREFYDPYIKKLINYCQIKDINNLKYENKYHIVKQLRSVMRINVNDLAYDINRNILSLLCDVFEIKLTSAVINSFTEQYTITTSESKGICYVQYTTTYDIKFVNLSIDNMNNVIVYIPTYLINNNKYTPDIIDHLDQLIDALNIVIFNSIKKDKTYFITPDIDYSNKVFNRFCELVVRHNLNKVFEDDTDIKTYQSILKSLYYDELFTNNAFQLFLFDKKYNEDIRTNIKKLAPLNDCSVINGYMKNKFGNLISKGNYFNKLDVFNPLLEFNKDFIGDVKIDLYSCGIFYQYNNKDISIYKSLNITNFFDYLKIFKGPVSVDNIIMAYFINDKENDEEIIEDTEFMTETCVDINKVVTKEEF